MMKIVSTWVTFVESEYYHKFVKFRLADSKNIFDQVNKFLVNPNLSTNQINKFKKIIKDFKTDKSSEIASSVLINSL